MAHRPDTRTLLLRGAAIGFSAGAPLSALVLTWVSDPSRPPALIESLIWIAVGSSLNAITGALTLPTVVSILRESSSYSERIWLTLNPGPLGALIGLAIGAGVFGGAMLLLFCFYFPGDPSFLFYVYLAAFVGGLMGLFTGIPLGYLALSVLSHHQPGRDKV